MAQEIEVYLVKAFGEDASGGNPAGVVLDARGLTNKQKSKIAADIGFSETAFVTKLSPEKFRVEFFTPTKQIVNCGHATVATFSLLQQKGMIGLPIVTVENCEGVENKVRFEGDQVYIEHGPALYTQINDSDVAKVIESLGLDNRDLLLQKPFIASTGNKFLILGLRSEAALRDLKPSFDPIAAFSKEHGLIGYYVFVPRDGGEFVATTRMFAPYYGINEESATGMAAAPLAYFLADQFGINDPQFKIEQGRFMAEPSLSVIEARTARERDRLVSISIGGRGFPADLRKILI